MEKERTLRENGKTSNKKCWTFSTNIALFFTNVYRYSESQQQRLVKVSENRSSPVGTEYYFFTPECSELLAETSSVAVSVYTSQQNGFSCTYIPVINAPTSLYPIVWQLHLNYLISPNLLNESYSSPRAVIP
jgi:hypothetical protein